MNKNKLPKWFDGAIYDTGETVKNPFSNEEFYLNNIELSMYDFIIGASMVIESSYNQGISVPQKLLDEHRKGLNWFMLNNPQAYMTLLD